MTESLLFTILLFAVGLVLIIKGGDWFVDSAIWIAEASHIPHFIIGATVVSLCTTLPELMVSSLGTMTGEVDLAVGNAVGSVTANTGLIMGISIVAIPSVFKKSQFNLKAMLLIASAGILWFLCFGGKLQLAPSIILFLIFAYFMKLNLNDAKKSMKDQKLAELMDDIVVEDKIDFKSDAPKKLSFFVIGIVAIVVGSDLLIDYGSALALHLGVPSAIIGVTMVAIGTSLPELVTTLTAIAKKEASMSIGNIIGANIIDLTMILPVCSVISRGNLIIAKQSYLFDMPACLLITAIALVPPLIKGKFYRWQGIVMLITYVAYVFLLVTKYGI